MSGYKTQQESFWAGPFGTEYLARNSGDHRINSNISMFRKILRSTQNVASVIEYGANIGLNLRAIRQILPSARLSAVEINETAVHELRKAGDIDVIHSSLLDFSTEDIWDMVLVKGVLIHLNPDYLNQVYRVLYETASRYVCIAEYYNPTPVELDYRGNKGVLFKRDFAGEFMDCYPDMELLDYGFVYHRDPNHPQDDISWFLMKKPT